MTNHTVTCADRSVNILAFKCTLVMATETELIILSFKCKLKLRLVRVVTADAFTISNRCMYMVLHHLIALSFVAAETELATLCRKREFVVACVGREVARVTNPGTNGTVDILLGSNL
ncbi:MAG: hypothetical protein V3T31_00010 [candidate division Zixibacteria bacterium]